MAAKASKFLSSNVLPKQQRGGMNGISENTIAFGQYGLQALEPAWITSKQIEAGRRAIIRSARNGGKMWVRIFPYKSFTGKAAGTRMGRGKGAISYWAAIIKPGRILYEIGGVTETVARKAIAVAASKMPIQTRFNKFLG